MDRVTQHTFLRQNLWDLMRMQAQQAELNKQVSSGKRVYTPSVDPAATIVNQPSHRTLEELTQYDANLTHAQSWLSTAISTMASMGDQVARAKELAEQMATGTYSGEQREIISTEVEGLIGQLINLANVDVNGQYIFAGTVNNTEAATSDLRVDPVAGLVTAGAASTTGLLYASGTYLGRLSRSMDLEVIGVPAGGTPAVGDPLQVRVTYVDDFGRAITRDLDIEGVGPGNAVQIGDGLSISAEDRTYNVGDEFSLMVGRDRGNTNDISVNLSEANRMVYSYDLDELFKTEGYNSGAGDWVNLVDMISNWHYALAHDSTTQDYFESVPGVNNEAENRGGVNFAGDWSVLSARDFSLTATAVPAAGVPSGGDPLTMDYSYTDDSGATVTGSISFTGVGSANSVNLAGAEIYLSDDFFIDAGGVGDTYDLTLEQYNQGQEASQQLLERLDTASNQLLYFEADAGAKLNRLEVRQRLTEDHVLRLNDRLEALEDADLTQTLTELKSYEVMYTAVLQATALISNRSLVDYL